MPFWKLRLSIFFLSFNLLFPSFTICKLSFYFCKLQISCMTTYLFWCQFSRLESRTAKHLLYVPVLFHNRTKLLKTNFKKWEVNRNVDGYLGTSLCPPKSISLYLFSWNESTISQLFQMTLLKHCLNAWTYITLHAHSTFV